MDDLKLALILNAVSPRVGGVLVRGEKGTAKSTIVRALAELLPAVEVVPGCRFACDPAAPYGQCPDGPHDGGRETRRARLVELPVGASEDRLAGSLDLEKALAHGVAAFEPGLLAAAHRGVLYVDEVNLLHDHLVDLLLDAAALGTCYVEREGVSVRHAARFLLAGTMNPEEGELRPQLLDRFGLTVEVRASRDPGERAEVIRRRMSYERDPDGFAADWAAREGELAARIAEARERVESVRLPDAALKQIATVCAGFEVDGMRADLVTAHAAVAHAAWAGRDRVTTRDVREAARLALPHRRRRDPFDAPGLDENKLDELLDQFPDDPDDTDPPDGPDDQGDPTDGDQRHQSEANDQNRPRPDHNAQSAADQGPPDPGQTDQGHAEPDQAAQGAAESFQVAGAPYKARLFSVPGVGGGAPGRRSRGRSAKGRTVGSRTPQAKVTQVHLMATLRAAAHRGWRQGPVRATDLREAVREGREGNLVLFVVDASGSMGARKRMGEVKTAVLSLLLDAYQRRDKIGLITFRGDSAELVLPPTSSVEAGAARMRLLKTGGRTPIAAGLVKAAEVLAVERLRDPARRPLVVVVTDGRATSGDADRAAALLKDTACVVVDCESGPVRLGLAARLAVRLTAPVVDLSDVAHVMKAA
ncbi:VWA domain-containing protein [Herbidospora galbida]|uniref:Mg-protoporphyrin IX chelatase n=1 Tax=Herbidospora galbida TaxID=2575442 RepID=A0A4V5UXA1_9ACTN|nr:VWA domain-containing protein [Herbidospora galbida]TKK78783.1 VWA domain-containing protein [Herbidospora galbida]